MDKPKEFWLKKDEPIYFLVNFPYVESIHVIEYSAYEQLQSKLDKACEALEFYASRAVYERLQPDGDLIYCNEIAEQALAEIRKKDE